LAERPEKAEPLYEYAVRALEAYGVVVKKGVFGADMKIEQYNDGPVTILLDSKRTF
jgi:D-tyrosyl-tRNA(Tyr) deacylase